MIYKLLIRHWPIIILALIVGSLTLFPQIYANKSLGDDFQGIHREVCNDEIYYLARGKDVIDGYPFLSNPYLYEYKEGSPMQFWLADYIMAKPLAVLGVDIRAGYYFYDFFFPFILTILTYAIIYALSKSRVYGLSGAVFMHLGIYLEGFNRSPSPQFNFIFWLILLLFLILYIKTKEKKYVVLSAVGFGFLFHIYPYYWTFYLVLIGVFVFLNFIVRKKIDYRGIFYIVLGGAVIAIPYFISLFNSMNLPYYEESVYRLGMINTHFPSGIKVVIYAGIMLLLFFWLLKIKTISLKPLEIFLISGVLASVICMNQHLITGKNLEFSNHYSMPAMIWYFFALVYLIKNFFEKFEKYKRISVIMIVILISLVSLQSIINVVNKQIAYSDREVYWQNYASVFDWLRQNTIKDSVAFANSEISSFIPAYTENNVYYSRNANLFFMPNDEVKERFVINNYWEDFDEEFLRKKEREIWGVHYTDEYQHNLSKNKLRKLFLLSPKEYVKIPPEEIEEVMALEKEIKKQGFEQAIKKYRFDYLVWDKSKNANWPIEDLDFLEFKFEDNNVAVYKVKKMPVKS